LLPRSYRDPVQNGHVAEDKLQIVTTEYFFFGIRKMHVGWEKKGTCVSCSHTSGPNVIRKNDTKVSKTTRCYLITRRRLRL